MAPPPEFVRWREDWVSQERGSRVVHYLLEDAAGVSQLAVVGTERSVRHMFYVVNDGFLDVVGLQASEVRKWRSRREVVGWLASFLTEEARRNADNYEMEPSGCNATGNFMFTSSDNGVCSDITWHGPFWTCGKQLRHYEAFCRDGTTISTHSFVMVMSEEENRFLAYLEDMYEDRKGQKKVRVRWFHQSKEFACAIPPPIPHPDEVFITPHSQVISAECVDDLATILTREHYEKCSAVLSCSPPLSALHFCYRQYSKHKFRHFDLRNLRGYFSQAAVVSLGFDKENDNTGSMDIVKHNTPGRIRIAKQHQKLFAKCEGTNFFQGSLKSLLSVYNRHSKHHNGKKSHSLMSPRHTIFYDVEEKIELLCQDSGIRGCWFKCTVLKICHNSVKVRYDDVQDADESNGLEEWIQRYRLAVPDKLGMRWPARLTIRPCRNDDILLGGVPLFPGTAVDVWWNDGWWEGVIVSADHNSDGKLQVYFPGEDLFRICQRDSVRISKDWVHMKWVDIEPKPDILTLIASLSKQMNPPVCLPSAPVAESGSSAMSERELAAVPANSNEDNKQVVDVSLSYMTASIVEDIAQAVLETTNGVDNTGDYKSEVGVDADCT